MISAVTLSHRMKITQEDSGDTEDTNLKRLYSLFSLDHSYYKHTQNFVIFFIAVNYQQGGMDIRKQVEVSFRSSSHNNFKDLKMLTTCIRLFS